MLEVGGGEGVLTERLLAGCRARAPDRARPGLCGRFSTRSRSAPRALEIVWGDAMRVDLGGAASRRRRRWSRTCPTRSRRRCCCGRSPSCPTLRRWTVMVQREIAERLRARPGSRTYGSPSVARAAQLRGADAAHGSTLPSSFPGPGSTRRCWRCDRRGSGSDRPADARADPRQLRASPQDDPAIARARRRGAASRRRSTPGEPVPRPAAGGDPARAPARRCARSELPEDARAEMLRSGAAPAAGRGAAVIAPAKLNLCLYLGRDADDGLHELCSLFQPLELADRIDGRPRPRRSADEVVCEARRGPEPRDGRARRRCARPAGISPPVRVEIEKRIPVAAGLGGGSADAAAVLRLAAGEVPRPGSDRRRARRRRALAARRRAFALVAGAGERIEPLPPPASGRPC